MPSVIHSPGTAWHSVRTRAWGSMSGVSVTTVSCQKLPPTRVSRSGATTPIPTRPSWVSAPPTTTGVPAARPVSADARALSRPTTVPGSRTSGIRSADRPTRSSDALDHVRARRSNRFELEPADGSVTNRPVSRYRTQSLSIPMWAMRRNVSGSCAAIQRKRAGEVIETQSPPCSKIRRARPSATSSPASAAARESTFGHAQISRPSASYRTIPSRMLVLLTAATSAGRMAAPASASRMHSLMSAQLRVVSNTWDPGTPGSSACDHSRWPIATWVPASSNRTARQLPVPRSMASVWIIRGPTDRPRCAAARRGGTARSRPPPSRRRAGASPRSPRRCAP